MAISVTKPTVGGSENTWGTTINTGLDTLVDALNGTSGTVAPDLSTLTINGTDVTATAAELNTLEGVTATAAGLNTASTHYVPTGGIIMWSGSTDSIPSGWTLCDGVEHGDQQVPDLRDRFVVGAGSTYAVDATGGGTVALTEDNMPAHTHSSGTLGGSTNSEGSHTHSGTTDTTGAHTHTQIYGPSGGGSTTISGSTTRSGTANANATGSAGSHSHTLSIDSDGVHTHTVEVNSGSTGSNGSGTAFDIIPKYYALAYIMKL